MKVASKINRSKEAFNYETEQSLHTTQHSILMYSTLWSYILQHYANGKSLMSTIIHNVQTSGNCADYIKLSLSVVCPGLSTGRCLAKFLVSHAHVWSCDHNDCELNCAQTREPGRIFQPARLLYCF